MLHNAAVRVACLIFVIAGLLAGPAAAQSAEPDGDLFVRPPPSARSTATAMILSAVVPGVLMAGGATLMASGGDGVDGGLALSFAGGILGPSAGLWYAGHKGGLGILARTGAAGVIAYGARVAYGDDPDFDRCEAECSQEELDAFRRNGQYLMYAGATVLLLSTIHDIRAAVARNRERTLRPAGIAPPGLTIRRKGRNPDAAMALTLLVPAATIIWGRVMMTDDDLEPLGWIVIAYGTVIGPSTGVWYAGHGGGKGIGLRTLLGIVALIGGIKAFDDRECFGSPECQREIDGDRRDGLIIFGAASAAWVTSVLYDARAAGRATGRWNERRGLGIVPSILPTPTGRAPGLTLTMTF